GADRGAQRDEADGGQRGRHGVRAPLEPDQPEGVVEIVLREVAGEPFGAEDRTQGERGLDGEVHTVSFFAFGPCCCDRIVEATFVPWERGPRAATSSKRRAPARRARRHPVASPSCELARERRAVRARKAPRRAAAR